jgi:hypothetical protein
MELRKHRRFRDQFRSHFSSSFAGLPGEGLVHDPRAELFIREARVCWTLGREFGVAFAALQPDVSKRLMQVLATLNVEMRS